MSQFKVITTNTNNVWDSKKRYKVNSVVSHNDILYQNITGKNSSPDTLVDWIVSKALDFSCIPLSGTTVGNPVTGDIELDNSLGRRLSGNTAESYIEYTADGKIVINDESSGEVIASGVIIKGNSPTGNGISGTYDYSANITDLDYTQKVYVDGLRGKHISKTTTEINAIATPQAGETYFNTTLSTLCFWDGTAWKRVSHSAM